MAEHGFRVESRTPRRIVGRTPNARQGLGRSGLPGERAGEGGKQDARESKRGQADRQGAAEDVPRGPDRGQETAPAANADPLGVGFGEGEVARPDGRGQVSCRGAEGCEVVEQQGAVTACGQLQLPAGSLLRGHGSVKQAGDHEAVVGNVSGRGIGHLPAETGTDRNRFPDGRPGAPSGFGGQCEVARSWRDQEAPVRRREGN